MIPAPAPSPEPATTPAPAPQTGALHHVELRVADLEAATAAWRWLLEALGYVEFQRWSEGISWKLGDTYLVLEQAPTGLGHDRRGAGLSHLAFHAGSRAEVDALWDAAPQNGWSQLYAELHPWAGGAPTVGEDVAAGSALAAADGGEAGHYAAYLETSERFKVELVARDIHLQ
jgi:catechol 2,3-dioxygenase-like lactoylglutathione lyase family enzyme